MPPPGHDQLARHTARWCAHWPVARLAWLPVTAGTRTTWSCTASACSPGKRGRLPAGPTYLAGNRASTAGRPSPGPEGDR